MKIAKKERLEIQVGEENNTKKINITCHSKRPKMKSLMVISTDVEKTF